MNQEQDLAQALAIIHWIEVALEGGELDDFALSFPPVRAVRDLRARRQPPETVWVLYDADGAVFNIYTSKEEAKKDAVGPRFSPGYSFRSYRLMSRGSSSPTPEGERS